MKRPASSPRPRRRTRTLDPFFEGLEQRQLLNGDTITVGRVLSSWTAADLQGGPLRITYSVYNERDVAMSGVLLTTSLQPGVSIVAASQAPDRNGQELAWSLGTLAPFGSASVEVTVSLPVAGPQQVDAGASAYGTVDALMASDAAPAAVLAAGPVSAALLAPTVDADARDPFIERKAAELDYAPQRILDALRAEVGYEAYTGSLRGARGTLWSGAGNALDEASLGVALLRASGIPARYAHGTLTDDQARPLILSMFPRSIQLAGAVPAGATVAAPQDDPALLAEARDHYWIQLDTGTGFRDADTVLGPGIGQPVTATLGTFAEVPDALRHKVTISLDAEITNTATALFGLPGQSVKTVLEQAFSTAELVGRSLVVGQFVSSQVLPGLVFSAVTHTFSPYLAVRDVATGRDRDVTYRGTDFQQFLTSFPFGSTILTGLTLNMTLGGPGAAAETESRTLLDRIGLDIRRNGGVPSISAGLNDPPPLDDFDLTVVQVNSGRIAPAADALLASRFTQVLEANQGLAGQLAGVDLTSQAPEVQALLQRAVTATRETLTALLERKATSFSLWSQSETGNQAAYFGVRAYRSSPTIVLATSHLDEPTAGSQQLRLALDLRRNAMRVLAAPGQPDDAVLGFQVARGILDTIIEGLVMTPPAGTPPGAVLTPINTMEIFRIAADQGIASTLIGRENLARLDGLAISGEARARIADAAQAGKIVLVPVKAVTVGTVNTIAWFEYDPRTGETIGVSEDGGHAGGVIGNVFLTLFSLLNISNVASAGSFVVGYMFGGLLFNLNLLAYPDPYDHITITAGPTIRGQVNLIKPYVNPQDYKDYKDQLVKALNALGIEYGVALAAGGITAAIGGAFIAGWLLGVGVARSEAADPPVLPIQVALDALPLRPYQHGAGVETVAASLAPGAVQGQVQPSSVRVSGQVAASWRSPGGDTFRSRSLSAGQAVVRDANGVIVGSGAVATSAGTPVDLTVDGDHAVGLAGLGSLAAYAAATAGLGIAGEWTRYDAQLTGNLTLRLTTGALTLNGVALPAGTYTVTTALADLSGDGTMASPTFSGSMSIRADGAEVEIGEGAGQLALPGGVIDAANGLTLKGYAGTLELAAAGSQADSLTVRGTAAQVLAIGAGPTGLTADQNTPVSFPFGLRTSLAGSYDLQADAPAGWLVVVKPGGVVTVTPAPGLQGGAYTIRLKATSQDDPSLVVQGEVTVTVTPTQPGVSVVVNPDPVFTVPFNGAELPTSFLATIRNLGPDAETFTLSVPNPPAGFTVTMSASSLLIPAGETAVVGIYLTPSGTLPAPGTHADFTVRAAGGAGQAIAAEETEPFVVPEIHGVTLTGAQAVLATIPGTPTTAVLTLRAVGNVGEVVTLSSALAAGLTLDGLGGPITLAAGESRTITVTLTPGAAVPLNSTLTATITATTANQQVQTLVVGLRVAVPGADAIAAASSAVRGLGNDALADRLDDLSLALTDLVRDPASAVSKGQALAALDSVARQLGADPATAGYASALTASRQALADAATPAAVGAAVSALGAALDGLGAALTDLAAHRFDLTLVDNSQSAQPQTPIDFHVAIRNRGTASSTYTFLVTGLPAGVSASFNVPSITLAPGAASGGQDVVLTLTSTSASELRAFSFQVVATVEGTAGVSQATTGALTARREVVSVVSVATDPPFVDPGGVVTVSARVLNAVNREQQATATFVVTNGSGQAVFTSTPTPVALGVVTSLVTATLGTFDTTGLALGAYTVLVRLVDAGGQPISGGTGQATLLVGSPVGASLTAAPAVVPPGTSTVTSTLTIDSLQPPAPAIGLAGQAAVAGASGVARNGDYVYVAGTSGISVFNIAGANLQAPQLVRVVGSATNVLEIRGNLLIAVRQGLPNTKLDTYSLTDPSNPQFLGTTGNIPYSSATDIVVTDTHVFVAIVNLVFDSFSNGVLSQPGGLFAVNISNPAAPFFDGDAVALKGTPAGRDGVDDGVLFNDNGTSDDGVGVFAPIDTSGGNQMTWDLAQVSPTILLLMGSSATGGNTQAGVGLVRVVDVSDPRNMRLLRDIQVPGTVHAFGIAVDGDRAFVTATEGGVANFTAGHPFTGSVVLATLDLSDPADPKVIDTEKQPDLASGVTFDARVGTDLYAYGTRGATGTQTRLYLVDAGDPTNLVSAGIDVPAAIQDIAGGDGLVLTTDGASLIIYQILAPPGVPATAQVFVPKQAGVTIDVGSFSIPPSQVIAGTDFDTYVFETSLTAAAPSRTITWRTTVTGMQPGEARDLSLASTVSFTSQGTAGQLGLPAVSVAAAQVLGLTPASRAVRPGAPGAFTLAVSNPTAAPATYALAIRGVPAAWSSLPPSVTVAAGATVAVPFTLTSEALAAPGDREFVVVATAGGTTGEVGGTLTLAGDPVLPDAAAHGVVVLLTSTQATAGQGTPAFYTVRVVNTGSQAETYTLALTPPPGVDGTLGQATVAVPPGAGNYREVRLTLTPRPGTAAGPHGFTITATSGSASGAASGTLAVTAAGVSVGLAPSSDLTGRPFQVTVTNTGTTADTFDLALAGPAALAAELALTRVTLGPGQSQVVPVTARAIGFAFPDDLDLVATATSHVDPAVRGAAAAQVTIPATTGLAARFDTASKKLDAPGSTSLLLRVTNTGNLEGRFRLVISGTDGPITARLIGGDGLPAPELTIALPGLSQATVLVQVDASALGTGTIRVDVQSLDSPALIAQATAQVLVGTDVPDEPPVTPADTTGPTVTSLARLGFHHQPTLLVLRFSEPLDAARATNPANYVLTIAVPGRHGRQATRQIRIRSVEYDPTTNSVTLRPRQHLSLYKTFRLTVSGITDASGNPLDGDRDGTPGGAYRAPVNRHIYAGRSVKRVVKTKAAPKPAGHAHQVARPHKVGGKR
ncbi:transglutaminase domain-containing protein [Aquisphaera insulae]|uniref:transglutaminase domain-containing protein n=1 Tax=Aquisphaera insulae TaxID=2712864 RepID=UPI0013EDF339|nr:transglutaminase domain-containing protein [Aquisphaera insulae]